MSESSFAASGSVFQLRWYVQQISPLIIWRRVLLRADHTLADLHYTIQILMDWSDDYLHQFQSRRRYGIYRPGGIDFLADARDVRLSDLHLRPLERFCYEYNFLADWQLEIRLEQCLPLDPARTYPVCIGGARQAPPESCGGPRAFLALREHFTPHYITQRFLEMAEENGRCADFQEELRTFLYWLQVEHFDRRTANRLLRRYAAGDPA